MSVAPIHYRKTDGWKFTLTQPFAIQTEIRVSAYLKDRIGGQRLIDLSPSGLVTVYPGYCWDGPSGPSVDTAAFIYASLIHDALYQLMRLGLLDQKFRIHADRLMRKMNLDGGMSRFRAWYTYRAVRIGGASAARKTGKHRNPELRAP